MTVDLHSRALSDRIVLLGLAVLSTAGQTPAHTGTVVRTCGEHADSIRAETLGPISEAEVNRALNRLEADGHVRRVRVDDTSVVGKGRPQYALAGEPETVVEPLADDDEVGGLAAEVAAAT
jgi:DNA-binding HxlR family transcriptional regulator